MSDNENTRNVMAKTFSCGGCGASLEIPKNTSGKVKCHKCGNDCMLEKIIKNAELLAKENIEGGIPLNTSPAALHRLIIKILSKSPYTPLDVFEKIVVLGEEHRCSPVYCFDCEGSATFSYEVGHERHQTYSVNKRDGGSTVKTKTHIEWNTVTDETAVTETLFVPGEKNMAPLINELYSAHSKQLSHQLVDIEELEFPQDVETYPFNVTPTTAFNDFVKPKVDAMLKTNAETAFKSNQHARNLSMRGSRISKEMKRVILGFYRVVLNYQGQEFVVWVTGDGGRYYYEGLPFDSHRKQTHEAKKSALASVPSNKTGLAMAGIVAGVVWSVISFYNAAYLWGGIFTAITVMCGVLLPFAMKKGKKMDAQRANAKGDLEQFESQWPSTVNRFVSNKTALRGIYENTLTGNDEAFGVS